MRRQPLDIEYAEMLAQAAWQSVVADPAYHEVPVPAPAAAPPVTEPTVPAPAALAPEEGPQEPLEATPTGEGEPTLELEPTVEPAAPMAPVVPQEAVDWAVQDRMIDDRRRAALNPLQQARYERGVDAGRSLGQPLEEESFVDSYLTNPDPRQHVAGTVATGLGGTWDMPEAYQQRVIDQLYRRDQEGLTRVDVAGQIRSLVGAWEDALRLGSLGETDEAPIAGPGGRRPETAALAGYQPGTALGDAVGVLVGTLPPVGAVTQDGIYRGIAYRMDLKREAYLRAVGEGLSGAALEARVQALEAQPTGEQIGRTQALQTLDLLNQEAMPGPARTGALLQYAAEVPGGRLVAPYLRAQPVTAPRYFGPQATALNLASVQETRNWQTPGRARNAAIARDALARAVAGTIAWQVADGRLTGPGFDPGPEARRVTPDRPPYTVRIGEEDVPYPTEPGTVGELVGLIATHASLERMLPEHEAAYEEWAGMVPAITLVTGHVMAEPEALRAVGTLLGALRDGGAHASPLAPLLAAGAVVTAAAGTGVAGEVKKTLMSDLRGLRNFVWDQTVAAWTDVPAHRDKIDGRVVWVPDGWGGKVLGQLAAEWAGTDPKDIVRQELYNNEYTPPEYPWVVARPVKGADPWQDPQAAGLELTRKERDFWITATTQQVRLNGRTLREALEYLMSPESPYWRQSGGLEGGRRRLIQTVFSDYMAAGKAVLMDPERGSRHLAEAVERAEYEHKRRQEPRTSPLSPEYGKREAETRRKGPAEQVFKTLIPTLGQ
jgi:hypothetical protein